MISSRFGLPKKAGVGLCEDQIDQRLLFHKAKEHGKSNLRFCNTQSSNPKDCFQSSHYRTCKCWQDIHFAENMRHYGESSRLPENVRRFQGLPPKSGKDSNLFVAMPLVLLPQGST